MLGVSSTRVTGEASKSTADTALARRVDPGHEGPTFTPAGAKAYLDAFDYTGHRIRRKGDYYSVPLPDDRHMVFPPSVTTEMLVGAQRAKKRKLFALAEPDQGGSPMILLGEPSDYDQHIKGVAGNAGRITVGHRAAAILGIMEWFQRRPTRLPSTLCLNCFTHHLPHRCRDTQRDYHALIAAAAAITTADARHYEMSACPRCGLTHPPQRGRCGIPTFEDEGQRQ